MRGKLLEGFAIFLLCLSLASVAYIADFSFLNYMEWPEMTKALISYSLVLYGTGKLFQKALADEEKGEIFV
jgi:hypothetical protein